MYEIKTTGETVTSFREKVGASQSDIAGGKYSRSYISQIEHNKSTLNHSAAEHITEKIKNIAKQNNVELEISVDMLLQTEHDKVRAVCNDIIKDIKTYKMKKNTAESLDAFVNQIGAFIEEHKNTIDQVQLCEIYQNISELYLNERIECGASDYFTKTIELSIKIDNYEYALKLILALTLALRTQGMDNQIISLGNYSYTLYKRSDNKDDIFKKIFFNVAKANKHVGKMEECMKYLNLIEEGFALTTSQIYELKALRGDCYKDLEDYKLAENTFLNLLNEAIGTENNNIVALCYISLAEIKVKTGYKKKAKEYLSKAQEFKVDEWYEPLIKYESFKLYISLDELVVVKKDYDGVIKLLVENKEDKSLYSILNNIAEYFIIKHETNSLKILSNLVNSYIAKGEIKLKNIKETLYTIIDYLLNEDIETARAIIRNMNKFKQCVTSVNNC